MRGGGAEIAAMMLMATPAAADLPPAAARVEGHALTRTAEETVRIAVPDTATYAGTARFVLSGAADCELHLFVEADDARRVKRFWWVQFESFLSSQPDRRYNYADNRAMAMWGLPVRVRANFGETSDRPRAGSDGAEIERLLNEGGYTLPPAMMSVRMVHMLDDPAASGRGRRELMLIHAEDLAPAGMTLDALETDGKPNARWTAIEPALIERAEKAVTVEVERAQAQPSE